MQLVEAHRRAATDGVEQLIEAGGGRTWLGEAPGKLLGPIEGRGPRRRDALGDPHGEVGRGRQHRS